MASAFAFLPPVQGDLPHYVSPARSFTWAPVNPTSTRLRWTRSTASKASLTPSQEPSGTNPESTHSRLRHPVDQVLGPLIVGSSTTTLSTNIIAYFNDAGKASIRSQCLTIVPYSPPAMPQQELNLALVSPVVAPHVHKATLMTTFLADLTAPLTYHSLSVVVYDDQPATRSKPSNVAPSVASTAELCVRVLTNLAANYSLIATAVLREPHDGLRTNATATANVGDADTNQHKVHESTQGATREVTRARCPALSNRLRIQRVQRRVYDFQRASKRKAKAVDAKDRHAPTSASTPVPSNKNVASRLFSYLKDATYLGHRAESKTRRCQASAASNQRRWL
ncbi:uncharacterized protein PITG_06669 [Phytophthora infestans T30-4]|uniref:Uncharacterized protein n=1 Tax=Phytophthora infestans (strain T30-4) TaxID=403677 RepID=D0N5E2_PHYIT|nr:uncharacterized protein PITG_06669 [Phytophthora infestans T30-4]EEY70100.1 conserved hypothetical protein [Phytophthora infestans T30-4]|eukprot:XP_002998747.1 conserved hypothetical protein [Phytophthora infestans T30-4]